MNKSAKNLFETSTFLDAILDCADFSIIATDYSGIIRHFSKGAEKLLGYSASEMIGYQTPEIFHCPEEVKLRALELSAEFNAKIEPGFQVFVKKAELGNPEERIWTYINKNKKRIPVKLSVTTLKDKDGNFIGFLGIAKDISNDMDYQEELSRLRKFHEIVIDNADVWINVLDKDGNITIWNRAAERISGYSKEEVLGNPKVWEWFYPIKKYREDVFAKAIEILNAKEIVTDFETKIKRKDGNYRIINWNSRVLLDESGINYGSIAIGNDITKLKRAEAEQDEFKKKLEEKNKDLENVVYVTSHDLRSPLVNIQGFTKEIETSLDEVREIIFNENITDDVKEKLNEIIYTDIKESNEFINTSVLRMNNLLTGLLNLSRLGRSELMLESVNLDLIFDEIIKTNEYRIKEERVKIIRSKLPVITADFDKVNQIFSNLIVNALKYKDAKKDSFIKISGRSNDNYHIISISDNGLGIEDKHIDKIFEIFYQLNPESSEGEGLGLSIVNKLVDKHKGNVSVESEKGVGTTFHVSFPIV